MGNVRKEKEGQKYYPVMAQQYRLVDEIGRGGSAVVYSAVCLPYNEIVAIKCLDMDKANEDISKVEQEAQTMRLVSHPNVLSAHCAFIVNTHLWEVMPFMAAGSVHTLLKTNYPNGMEKEVIATILKETLKALIYLHKEGHIHRDVKAANVLVDADGSVKLADLGVSAFIFESGDREKMKRHTCSGTIFWMAPEVLSSDDTKEGYDCKADIWSFGITAMELAVGHPPFSEAKSVQGVISKILRGIIPQLPDGKFSNSFKEMVSMCLVLDPRQRPTAEKLLKHSFFKNHAKTPKYIVEHVLHGLQPLSGRLKTFNDEEYGRFKSKALAAQLLPLQPPHPNKKENYEKWDFDVYKESHPCICAT